MSSSTHGNNPALPFTRILLLTLIPAFISTSIRAQRSTPPFTQSAYHDAIALYYALNDYKAIPVLMTDDEAGAASEANAAAQLNGEKVIKYKIVESATGKVIVDNIDALKVDSAMKSDATLYKFGPGEKRAFVNIILARNANSDDTSQANIDALYKDNTYFFDPEKNALGFLSDSTKFKALASGKLIFSPAGGGVSLTTKIAEGTVEFLIEAVNKEINEAFFVQMEKILAKIDELGILFPNTLQSLEKIEVTKYASSLNAMKAAFNEDINNLLANVGNLTTLKKYRDLIDRFPPLTLLFAACDLIDLLKSDAIPAEIIYQLSMTPYIRQCASNNYNSSIRLAALISNSLRDIRIYDENKDRISWIDRTNLNLLRDNASVFRIFMGLFAQQANGIVFKTDHYMVDLQKTLFLKHSEVLKGHFIVYNFTATIENIKKKTGEIQQLKKTEARASEFAKAYLEVANDINELAENCLSVLPSIPEIVEVRKQVNAVKNDYLPLLNQAAKVLASIEEKEYSRALYQADTLLSKIFDERNLDKLKTTRDETQKQIDAIKKDASNSVPASLIASNQEIDSIISTDFAEIRKYYLKYGLFISAVASAKTSEDVKEALKAVALPTGSSRIKKTHNFSISLNAYVGFYHAWNQNHSEAKLPETETGLTVPIGFALNWGHFLKGSLTAYVGIVDVGAIFTYKVNTDSSLKSDIEFGQLFSPSIGLVYGLPIIQKHNIPLSVGVNYQWGPKLRKVDEAGNSVLPLLTQRINVFIAVDIPILNFRVSRN
ncbi:MAG: hypothetical protein E6H09_15390 [Bacteroidetes bacterium]|jgi:hypothetical protein|nr:MAG: hypothetical protein E6H09_15390 [Bacteroidota bacterium]